ncbi:DUF1385 domain-containing protein [Clostridium sp. 'deep sea']|uniref:DUF1385 domain-containing protein n=1 Tax=Clostridium sp. 'deep sea' TaxID=2779445 RepID=UPI00189649D4|nr:DUF1385 domain-containing protein [Clostridium sp. 'deep sea']QOR34936.1 DUF1385 domain-containing protein [Clostridium sp. 'deep sea']
MSKINYGGQALIEGLMIKGPQNYSIAIRKQSGEIEVTKKRVKKNKFAKIPILRGMVEFFNINVLGVKAIMYSAEQADESFTQAKNKSRLTTFLYLTVTVSLLFSIALFMLLPNLIVSLFKIPHNVLLNNILEGIIKLSIFIGYLVLTSFLKDIKRVWMYHGAEHKVIHCYENKDALTINNVKKYSTKHVRCGTSFLFLIIIISILLFSVTGWHNIFINILIRLLLVPLVAGVSYEVFKLVYKYNNKLTRFVNKLGICFQYFTTKEPDDEQIEVAIAAFNSIL